MAAVALTPMVLYLAAGINPNSLEVAATMAAFCGFVVTLDNAHRIRHVAPAVVTVVASTIVLANTRQVSLVWLLCALITGLLLFRASEIKAAFRNRLVLTGVAVAVPGVALGLYWIYLMLHAPANSGAAPEGIASPDPGMSIFRAFLTMVERASEFVPQYIGVMGWLDSPVPMVVVMFWSMWLVFAILLPLTLRPFKMTRGAWAALALLIIVPAVLQASIWKSMGFIWQGRYNLPLLVVFLIAVGMTARSLRIPRTAEAPRVARVLLWAGVFCHVLAFVFVLRRYAVGTFGGGNWLAMINGVLWQPPLGWALLTLAYLAVMVASANSLFRFLFPGLSPCPHPVSPTEPENNCRHGGTGGSHSDGIWQRIARKSWIGACEARPFSCREPAEIELAAGGKWTAAGARRLNRHGPEGSRSGGLCGRSAAPQFRHDLVDFSVHDDFAVLKEDTPLTDARH